MARDQMEGGKMEPADLHDLLNVIRAESEPSPSFDVVLIGINPDPLELQAYAQAGATWWMEASGPWSKKIDEMKQQIRGGPPKT